MAKSKTKTLEEHTAKRLRERYGLKYTQLLHDTLLYHVRSGKAVLIIKQSRRVTVFDTVYEARDTDICNSNLAQPGKMKIRFAYDCTRKTLITALLPDMNPDDLVEDDLCR